MKALLNHTPVNADVTSGYTIVTVDRLRPTMQAIEDRLLQLGGLKATAEVVPMRGRGDGGGCPSGQAASER